MKMMIFKDIRKINKDGILLSVDIPDNTIVEIKEVFWNDDVGYELDRNTGFYIRINSFEDYVWAIAAWEAASANIDPKIIEKMFDPNSIEFMDRTKAELIPFISSQEYQEYINSSS